MVQYTCRQYRGHSLESAGHLSPHGDCPQGLAADMLMWQRWAEQARFSEVGALLLSIYDGICLWHMRASARRVHQAILFIRETKDTVRVSLQEYLFAGSSKATSCGFWQKRVRLSDLLEGGLTVLQEPALTVLMVLPNSGRFSFLQPIQVSITKMQQEKSEMANNLGNQEPKKPETDSTAEKRAGRQVRKGLHTPPHSETPENQNRQSKDVNSTMST